MSPSVRNESIHAERLDALSESLAPAVHAALDQAPSDALRCAVSAAASQRLYRRARVNAYVWSSVISMAAAAVLAVCSWSIQHRQAARRMQLLDNLLVLASESDASPGERDLAAEALAERLLFLQGFDADAITPAEAEDPEPPAIDAQWRNTRALPPRICG